jgi:hypothetical protein
MLLDMGHMTNKQYEVTQKLIFQNKLKAKAS